MPDRLKAESRPHPTKDALLNAAEALFSKGGFAATSTKAVAERAGVPQSLVHYHFKSKAELFSSVFKRLADRMNNPRLEALDRCLSGAKPQLEAVLEILVSPIVGLGRDEDINFYHVVNETSNEDLEEAEGLITQTYDPLARRFIDAFKQVLPGLEDDAAVLAYTFTVSMSMGTVSNRRRVERLSHGNLPAKSSELIVREVVNFCAAGLRNAAEKKQ